MEINAAQWATWFRKDFALLLLWLFVDALRQGLMVLLQSLPTEDWSDKEVDLVLADAYRLKFMFADAPKHLGDVTS